LLLYVKLGQKLVEKMSKAKRKSSSQDEFEAHLTVSKVTLQAKRDRIQRYVNDLLGYVSDFKRIAVLNESIIHECQSDLRGTLKLFIKEKLQLYKLKVEKSLFGKSHQLKKSEEVKVDKGEGRA